MVFECADFLIVGEGFWEDLGLRDGGGSEGWLERGEQLPQLWRG